MRRVDPRGWRGRCCTVGALAFITAMAGAPRFLHATPIVFRIFNLGETTAYVVQRNARTVDTEATTPLGVFSEQIDATAGDRITLIANEDMAPPVPPLFTSAAGQPGACARLTWTPTGDMTVIGYIVSYGALSVELGQATDYQFSAEAGPVSSFDVCGLAGTIYYFAVQAVNHVGQVSAYSRELRVEMTTTPVLISRFDATASRESVRLSWDIVTDEVIEGFTLYRVGPGATERVLTAAPLPPDADSFVDTDVRSGTTYTYTLAALQEDGSQIQSAPVTATTPTFALGLSPSAPNPFQTATRIPFTLDAPRRVTVRVYDVRGSLVATLFDGTLPEGNHEVGWGGHNASGQRVAAGTYFCTLSAGKFMHSQKMLLLR